MKVAIYSRVLEQDQQKDVQLLFDELEKESIIPVVFEPLFAELKKFISLPPSCLTFSDHTDLNQDIDFVISLGGDGTLLDTVTLIRDKRLPVVGINFGRLGFLASIGRNEMTDAVNDSVNHAQIEAFPQTVTGKICQRINNITVVEFINSPFITQNLR